MNVEDGFLRLLFSFIFPLTSSAFNGRVVPAQYHRFHFRISSVTAGASLVLIFFLTLPPEIISLILLRKYLLVLGNKVSF